MNDQENCEMSHPGDEQAAEMNSQYFLDQERYEDADQTSSIEASDTITAISLSSDGHYLLANVSLQKPRIECWDLNTSECVQKYRGHEQRNYVLKPIFGGIKERLVICGSEDSSICIWSRDTSEMLAKIQS